MASELMRSDGPYSSEERRQLDLLGLMLSISQAEAERIDSVFELLHAPLQSACTERAGIDQPAEGCSSVSNQKKPMNGIKAMKSTARVCRYLRIRRMFVARPGQMDATAKAV